MKQREVQDANHMRWTCVEALSGVGDASAASSEAAADKVESDDGSVPVACTPSGGASSVRIRMPRGWDESASDAELLAAIAAVEHS